MLNPSGCNHARTPEAFIFSVHVKTTPPKFKSHHHVIVGFACSHCVQPCFTLKLSSRTFGLCRLEWPYSMAKASHRSLCTSCAAHSQATCAIALPSLNAILNKKCTKCTHYEEIYSYTHVFKQTFCRICSLKMRTLELKGLMPPILPVDASPSFHGSQQG